jgi:hypothetical protein
MPATREALAHKAQIARIKSQAALSYERVWRELGSYNRDDLSRLLTGTLPIAQAAQRQTVGVTNALIARRLKRAPAQIDPLDYMGERVRGGVSPEEVYARPLNRYWHMLKQGATWEEAQASGLAVASASLASDVMLSMRATVSGLQLREPGAWGYQRVPGGNACDYCILASTQRYYTGELEPLHIGCGCGVDIVTADDDPGQVINPDRLEAVKSGDSSLAIKQTGEYGPELVTNAVRPPVQGAALPPGGRRAL